MEKMGHPYLLEVAYTLKSAHTLNMTALQAVIDRHDILRWCGMGRIKQPVQVVWRKAMLKVECVEIDPVDGEITQQLLDRFNPRHYHMDISQAPLKHLFVAEDRKHHRLAMSELSHHLIDDHEDANS